MNPVMPHNDAGPRIEPPVSEPSEAGMRRAASAAPEPLDEPPGKCSRFHGLRAGGHGRANEGPPCANSCVWGLPPSTAPAATSFAVVVASSSGMLSIATLDPPVVAVPFVL